MRFLSLLGVATAALLSGACAQSGSANTIDGEYEYIVVGSGAGGGPLASRLAQNGHKVLLIEAGDSQEGNNNLTVPGYQAVVTQDPKLRWDIFVSHYQDLNRAKQDPKFVYSLPGGGEYTGLNPPAGAQPKGILYPRAAVLGGSISHNALIYIEPHASDWDNIAAITGDQSWSNANMQQYYNKVYEWQPVEPTDPTIILRDTKLIKHLAGGATQLGVGPPVVDTATGLLNVLANNPNNRLPGRDSTPGFFNIPLIMKDGTRVSVRERILSAASQYPLTIRTNCLVSKVLFDTSTPPKAIGVEFLDGAHLYKADPMSGSNSGTPGRVLATKEVILAGGAFNTPQLLKLSGVGPADELRSFNIPVVKDLPGVGTNMQDRYEIPVNTVHPDDFPILDGCTFDMKAQDQCYQQWLNNPYIAAQRGAYATDGLAAAMVIRSQTAATPDNDLFIFGGPVNFQGYFPRWGDFAVADHKHFSWYTLKAHTQNKAGTVKLASTDPRDQPKIDFNYFDTGTTAGGADEEDVSSIVEAIKLSRKALQSYYDYPLIPGSAFTEEKPGPNVQSDDDLKAYIKRESWGHHASCTCPIGADNDPLAVLDAQFRVRGVQNLRVVDASVFPRIPGVFIQAPIFIMAEKAADVILNTPPQSTTTTSSTTSTSSTSTSTTTVASTTTASSSALTSSTTASSSTTSSSGSTSTTTASSTTTSGSVSTSTMTSSITTSGSARTSTTTTSTTNTSSRAPISTLITSTIATSNSVPTSTATISSTTTSGRASSAGTKSSTSTTTATSLYVDGRKLRCSVIQWE